MNLIGLLVWFADSLGARVLTSLGIGFISFAAVKTAADVVVQQFSSAWSAMPVAVLNIASLAGFPGAFGWIIGAYIARLSLTSISKLGRVAS